eukprot:14801016-Heterocapsa_arctica.AAC.1
MVWMDRDARPAGMLLGLPGRDVRVVRLGRMSRREQCGRWVRRWRSNVAGGLCWWGGAVAFGY